MNNEETPLERLGVSVIPLLEDYYNHRELSKIHCSIKWNKEQDLKNIFAEIRRHPLYAGVEASAGTIWVHYSDSKIVKVDVEQRTPIWY